MIKYFEEAKVQALTVTRNIDIYVYWVKHHKGTTMTIYHGSNVIVKIPKILTDGYAKDFGYGFYCASMEEQARRWTMTKGPSYEL